MTDEIVEFQLDELANMVRDISAQAINGERRIIRHALTQQTGWSGMPRQWVGLRSFSFDTVFQIRKSESKRILFFFGRGKTVTRNVLDASISMKVGTVSGVTQPRNGTEWGYYLHLPSFVEQDLGRHDPARFKKLLDEPRATPGNSILFRAGAEGKSFLGVVNPDRSNRRMSRKIVYTSPSGRTSNIERSESRSIWTIKVLLQFVDAIVRWDQSDDVRLKPYYHSDGPGGEEGDVSKILDSFVDACRAGHQTLATDPLQNLDPVGVLMQRLDIHKAIRMFDCRVKLLINSDGTLAFREADDPVQMALRIKPDYRADKAVHLYLELPDFVMTGDRKNHLIKLAKAGILSDKVRQKIHRTWLGKRIADSAESLKEPLSDLLRSAHDQAVAFRVKRNVKSDENYYDSVLLIFRGSGRWKSETLIVKCKYKVELNKETGDTDFELKESDVDLGYFGRPGSTSSIVDDELTDYFLRFASIMHCWTKALQ